jgi:hypothetical protein
MQFVLIDIGTGLAALAIYGAAHALARRREAPVKADRGAPGSAAPGPMRRLGHPR